MAGIYCTKTSSVTGMMGSTGQNAPPPIKTAQRFENPVATLDLDDQLIVKNGLNDVPVVPPDVVDAPLAKQLDSLGLLLGSTYSTRLRRKCPGVGLPTEMLSYADLRWIVAGSSSPEKRGKKNLDTVYQHRGDPVVIDSPRSVLSMMRLGYPCESLRRAQDDLTEARRQRTISALRAEYAALCAQVSRLCVVEHIRRQAVPDVQDHPRSPDALSPLSHTSTVKSSDSPGRRNLRLPMAPEFARLMRHRDQMTSEWGIAQQKLALEAYVAKRVTEKKEAQQQLRAMQPAVSPKRIQSVPPSTTPATFATITPQPNSEAQQRSVQSCGRRAKPSPLSERVLMARTAMQRRTEVQRASIEAKQAKKDHLAALSAERKSAEREKASVRHLARETAVKDANSRMIMKHNIQKLLLARSLEDDAARAAQRKTEQISTKQTLQELQRVGSHLRQRIRSTLKENDFLLQQALFEQEVCINSNVANQRAQKERSRDRLRTMLRREEGLMSEWKHLSSRR